MKKIFSLIVLFFLFSSFTAFCEGISDEEIFANDLYSEIKNQNKKEGANNYVLEKLTFEEVRDFVNNSDLYSFHGTKATDQEVQKVLDLLRQKAQASKDEPDVFAEQVSLEEEKLKSLSTGETKNKSTIPETSANKKTKTVSKTESSPKEKSKDTKANPVKTSTKSISTCEKIENWSNRQECFKNLQQEKKKIVEDLHGKITKEMRAAEAADRILELKEEIKKLDAEKEKDKEKITEKENEISDIRQRITASYEISVDDYIPKETLSDDEKKKIDDKRKKEVEAKKKIDEEIATAKIELSNVESHMTEHKIRRGLMNLTKESSFFSVTGKRHVYEKDADGMLQYKETIDKDLPGLRATEHSREADLVLTGEDSKENLLTRAISILIQLIGTLVVLLFVIGAFFMITSQGDENQLQKGKTIFTYAIIGAVVAFMSYMIVQFVINIIFLNVPTQ